MNTTWNRPGTRIHSLLAVLALLLLAGASWAGGSRESPETQDPPEEVQLISVRGEVTELRPAGSDTVLTVRTDTGPEVEVEVPSGMVERLGVRAGDRFVSEEQILSNRRERLRVMRFSIER